MITCAVFFVFDAACLWDGCYVARCLDRPLFARLFSRKGAGKASDTADTGPSDNFDALTVAQLTLIILGAFTLDVLFTAVATFLPGRASVRGISGSTLGLMFAAYPVGQAVAALVAPAMLSQAWLDPVVGSRKALLGAALVVSAAGVIDEYATDATTFIAGVVGTRILQGFVRAPTATRPSRASRTAEPLAFTRPLTPLFAGLASLGEWNERGDGRRGSLHCLRSEDRRLRRLLNDRRAAASMRSRSDARRPPV